MLESQKEELKETIKILEMDELYTYIKKIQPMYGRLSTEIS